MRLKTALVGGLFDRFTYEIPLKLNERITIIHGPNGFGKTMILRMIEGFFKASNAALRRLPFRELHLVFDNGESVSVVRTVTKPTAGSERGGGTICFSHHGGATDTDTFTPRPDTRPEQLPIPIGSIENLIDDLDQVGPQSWRQRSTGEILSLNDVLADYSEHLPIGPQSQESDTPGWLRDIRLAVPVRFINTERLYTPLTRRESRHFPVQSREPAVRRYAQQLGEIVKQTLAEYGTLSQSLDRTFPARLVAEPERSDVTMESLRSRLAEIEGKRARLVEAGLLGREPEQWGGQFLAQVDETKRSVLSVFAQDAERKLCVFDKVLAKVDLFKKIINGRFIYKGVTVNQNGFQVVNANGTPLDPGVLSSGEQHELVLLYELLFRTSDNTLILIDEPELSLHIAWQEAFLNDLAQMAQLSRFDAIIATHSPQVIGDRWDLTVELKGPK
ncbi:MAG: AAA family ATPase [Deltaproteobacteria bacterium]|nr:AAA family ATPase [Deltaproteobacteria bacterium]MBI3387597.1 AAA family ATPase [Deltaproteobacteria bacterium]